MNSSGGFCASHVLDQQSFLHAGIKASIQQPVCSNSNHFHSSILSFLAAPEFPGWAAARAALPRALLHPAEPHLGGGGAEGRR